MRNALVVLVAGALSACVSSQPGAENVVLTGSASNVAGCRFIGQANVSAVQMLDPATNQKDVQTALRNKVVEMGGNRVLTSGPTAQNPSTLIQTGDIYRC